MSKIEEIEAFPLHWPIGYKRTPDGQRIKSPFKQSMEKAQQFCRRQIELLGAAGLIISTNIPTRKDGGLYTDYMSRKIDDPGVAIFFRMGSSMDGYTSMCCDQYTTVWENIYGLGKSIEAIRAIERYGTSGFMDRVFTGFKELPPAEKVAAWWIVLGVPAHANAVQIREAYLEKVKSAHPDAGGSPDEFIRIQKAYEEAING